MDRNKELEEKEEQLKADTENLHNFYMSLVMPEYRDVIDSGQLVALSAYWYELGKLSLLNEIRATIDENFDQNVA